MLRWRSFQFNTEDGSVLFVFNQVENILNCSLQGVDGRFYFCICPGSDGNIKFQQLIHHNDTSTSPPDKIQFASMTTKVPVTITFDDKGITIPSLWFAIKRTGSNTRSRSSSLRVSTSDQWSTPVKNGAGGSEPERSPKEDRSWPIWFEKLHNIRSRSIRFTP